MVVLAPISKCSFVFATSSLDALKANFKGDLITPDHPDYEEAIQRWAKNAVKRAKIVAFVKDAYDASLAVRYARESGLPLAVRGGGHNPAGSSSSEGIVIDLSRYINECHVEPEEKLAYVGGGALWKTVDETAIKYGLATVAGTVNHTGVGGLTLGGGFGWLSAAHGLVIDNLVQATMVTADGSIITTSEDENSDLFWAIRGGGCNFGICLEFVFQLHEQRPTAYSGVLIYPPPLVDNLSEVTEKWWKSNMDQKSGMLQAITRGPPPDYMPCVVVIPFYNGTEEEGRANFKEFLDIGPVDLTREMPYEQVNAVQNPSVPHGRNYYMRGAIQRNYSSAVARAVFERMCQVSSKELTVTLIFELYPLEKINSVASDATAFNLRGPDSNILCIAAWDEVSQENATRGKEAAYALTDIIAIAEGRPEVSRCVRAYGNYVGEDKLCSNRAQRLFGDNYPRLQQIKKKYDPDMLFSNWFQIVPM